MAGPLKGMKILDFTTLLPGPYATMTLADLGVGDAVQLVGHRQKRFRKELEFFDVDRQFARVSQKQKSLDTHKIAAVEELEDRPTGD